MKLKAGKSLIFKGSKVKTKSNQEFQNCYVRSDSVATYIHTYAIFFWYNFLKYNLDGQLMLCYQFITLFLIFAVIYIKKSWFQTTILACRRFRVVTLLCFVLFFPNWQGFQVKQNSTVCDLLQWAKQQGY